MSDLIKRNFPAEFRTEESDEGVVIGIPIVFDTPTDIGGWFEEVILPEAISEETLKEDIRFFWNHNIDEKALARSIIPFDKKGGMVLTKTEKGIEAKIRLNLARSDAKDTYLSIQDGTVNAMSFMFGVEEETWERENTDYPKRIIKKISPVVEISAVNFPAYKTTSIKTARADLSTEIDKVAVENMRKNAVAKSENLAKRELELAKLKAEILYK